MSFEAIMPLPRYRATCPAEPLVFQNMSAPGGGLRSVCRIELGIEPQCVIAVLDPECACPYACATKLSQRRYQPLEPFAACSFAQAIASATDFGFFFGTA